MKGFKKAMVSEHIIPSPAVEAFCGQDVQGSGR